MALCSATPPEPAAHEDCRGIQEAKGCRYHHKAERTCLQSTGIKFPHPLWREEQYCRHSCNSTAPLILFLYPQKTSKKGITTHLMVIFFLPVVRPHLGPLLLIPPSVRGLPSSAFPLASR